jgi:hypothetical protein
MLSTSSVPSFSEFDPTLIPYQIRVLADIYERFDYKDGKHEVLLSGSIGSAKSLLMAHLVIRHCLETPRARVLLGRKSMPDLKDTIFSKILEHMEGDFVQDVHYYLNAMRAYIRFNNGSEIMSRSWADNHPEKVRSLDLSMAVIEELTETDNDNAYNEIAGRVGRLSHVDRCYIISATNPDSPSHWAYKYFMETPTPTKHVYYSITTDNPFLPSGYVKQLKANMDAKRALRMIYGQWVAIDEERIYHAFGEHNVVNFEYIANHTFETIITFDFNIGQGKPMSCALIQYDSNADTFHVYGEAVIEGASTNELMDDLFARGLLKSGMQVTVCGDAAGKHRDTRSKRSDYDIIYQALQANNVQFVNKVLASNPPIRSRHNLVNAYCKDANGRIRLYVYPNAKVAKKGLDQSALKKGAGYIEDDSKAYQHITTSLGYCVNAITLEQRRGQTRSIEL